MSVLVLGSINTDLVICGPRLPRPGETVLGGEFYQAAGGKGANQAVAAARASRGGEQVVFLAAVGDDELGKVSLMGLARENIDCSGIKVVPSCASGVALILVDAKGENCISVASGANMHLRPEDVEGVPEQVFRRCRVFLASLESPLETVQRGLTRAKQMGLKTVLNPAPVGDPAAVRRLFSLVDVLTPNAQELAALSGMNVGNVDDALAAARHLRTCFRGAIIVTQGELGALVVEECGRSETISAQKVQAVDATAAGDCFSGALAACLAEGKSLAEAARFAARAAGIAVTRRGARPSLPTKDEIEGRQLTEE